MAGLGRHLVSELLADARGRGMHTLKVQTFSLLTAAARIYRGAGFRVVWEQKTDWYGAPVTHQVYELHLGRIALPRRPPPPLRGATARPANAGRRLTPTNHNPPERAPTWLLHFNPWQDR